MISVVVAKKKPKYGFMPLTYMWCAHTTKLRHADREDRPHHHPVAEDVAAGVRAEQVGDDAERRQRDDVDLGMAEEPEQVLEQQRAAAAVHGLLAHRDDRRHEEARADEAVERHHDRADTNSAGNASRPRIGRHEDAPHRQRHAHQRHAAAARLQHRRDVVQAAHRERDDEDRERDEHQMIPQLAPGVPAEIACGG